MSKAAKVKNKASEFLLPNFSFSIMLLVRKMDGISPQIMTAK